VLLEELTEFHLNVFDAEAVGFQVSEDANRVWLCINGVSVVRVKGIKNFEFTDLRKKTRKKVTGKSVKHVEKKGGEIDELMDKIELIE
jgi:hypothetical protein